MILQSLAFGLFFDGWVLGLNNLLLKNAAFAFIKAEVFYERQLMCQLGFLRPLLFFKLSQLLPKMLQLEFLFLPYQLVPLLLVLPPSLLLSLGPFNSASPEDILMLLDKQLMDIVLEFIDCIVRRAQYGRKCVLYLGKIEGGRLQLWLGLLVGQIKRVQASSLCSPVFGLFALQRSHSNRIMANLF